MPPVSMSVIVLPFHVVSKYILSRVTPGVSSTIEMRSPAILLKSVLLPTFGLPTIAAMVFPISLSSEYFVKKIVSVVLRLRY